MCLMRVCRWDGTGRNGKELAWMNSSEPPPKRLCCDRDRLAMEAAQDEVSVSGAAAASAPRDKTMRNLGIETVLSNPQPYADADAYEPGQQTIQWLKTECRVLVIGAGGLGCEVLKNLALSGFTDIHVIDMDNIDITNLNRQFLFREADVGRPKASVAAEFLIRRFSHLGLQVKDYVDKIQSFDSSFYTQFNLIIGALDNIDARRWINSCLHSLVNRDPATGEIDISTVRPFLDGGTEGLKGQARIIFPSMTSCFDCSLETFPEQVNYPLCTIAETPRLPEHCIEYAMLILWEKNFGKQKLNPDDPDDMRWLFDAAKTRARAFGISGVTYQLTIGVVKRVVPAVASTNALIAASLVNEAFKIATYCNPPLNNYLMYMGHEGIYTFTFEFAQKKNCLVCGGNSGYTMTMPATATLRELLKRLGETPELQLKRPSISGENVVFMQNPPQLRKLHEDKLDKSLGQLQDEGVFREKEDLIVTDPAVGSKMVLRIELEPPKA